jgi:rubrerythrin
VDDDKAGDDKAGDDKTGEDKTGEDTAGGEPVCWLARVCPECGLLADGDLPAVCPRCGAPPPLGDAPG